MPSPAATIAIALAAAIMLSTPSAAATSEARAVPAQANFFISGHSLTDMPLPTNIAAVAGSLGTTMQWNRQYVVGSPIRVRSRGPEGSAEWSGYRQGENREGKGLDVVSELRRPATLGPGGRYDMLIITEQNGLFETMLWHDTVRHLRHFHERFIEGNAKGQTYFYEPWTSLNDLSDPRRWIALERQATKFWQCVVTRVNLSLSAEGRADRIVSLPTGIALAALVERATQGPGLPGLSGQTVSATIGRLFEDDVHLTALGSYYVSLVVYAAVFQRSPAGAWAPPGVDAGLARTLQDFAWTFVADHKARNQPLDMAQCRTLAKDSLINEFYGYLGDTWKRLAGPLRAEVRRWKRMVHWHIRIRRDNDDNPFYFDPATDKTYWFAAP